MHTQNFNNNDFRFKSNSMESFFSCLFPFHASLTRKLTWVVNTYLLPASSERHSNEMRYVLNIDVKRVCRGRMSA